ncbi:hypothetical protein [Streptomyces marianii]|uniref:Uncharacterized protein n=1 Tax=Streptomyces marianii TaxID=1817406 RepID=A0A5R9E1L2_9ACTN|nr:hypothetical protein [Streptomyces marianii]TLQ43818.1 hypothetical protein FEF34_12310 [Streptomyces marianii]
MSGIALKTRSFPFAFDWNGRELLFDIRDPEARPRYVIMVDPEEGEHYTTDLGLDEFWVVVADEDEDALAFDYFVEWRKANPGAGHVGFDQVVGYKVPLSLGGGTMWRTWSSPGARCTSSCARRSRCS